MTERGLPIADGAPACPFVAFDDARDDRSDHPDPRHRCYAESPPSPRARAHQEAYCLSSNFPVCPTFQDWARREAARVLPAAAGGSPAERLRDVPAQREAGARPPAFEPTSTASDWPAGRGTSAMSSSGIPGEPEPAHATLPPVVAAAASGAILDQVIGGPRADDDRDVAAGASASGDASHDPWDLPTRRPVQPEWSAPPPWANGRPAGESGDVEPPDFLRASGGAGPREEESWAAAGLDGVPYQGDGADQAPADREATMARLRELGMGDTGGGANVAADAALAQRSAASLGRPVSPDSRSSTGMGAPGATVVAGAAVAGAGLADDDPAYSPARRAAAASAALPAAEGSTRQSSGLAKLLGWDRRPKAGAARPVRRAEKEPAWERPRRFEAYPTLKTRVGMPSFSRLWLAAGAVVVAALILFFVPPLFLKQDAGTGVPGATRTPAASSVSGSGAASSPTRSAGPTAKPGPTQLTYTVKPGDTMSSIARRFHVTIDAILAANKSIKNPDKIAIGVVLVIPSAAPSEVIDGGASATP